MPASASRARDETVARPAVISTSARAFCDAEEAPCRVPERSEPAIVAAQMLRFTFVVARYGADILGGAEKHARDVAEQLAGRGHDVRIQTTCATSYTTWQNDMAAGLTYAGGVEIRRHPTTRGRLRPFDDVMKTISGAFPSVQCLAHAWATAQGPTCPGLLNALEHEQDERDLFVFFSLLSILTFSGMRSVAKRAALVPLVHEERPIYTRLARETLRMPRVLLLNTEEEAQRIKRVAGSPLPTVGIVAVGTEDPPPRAPNFRAPTSQPYVIVLGRLAKTKPMLPVWRALTTDATLPPLEYEGRTVPWAEVALVTVGELSPLYAGIPNVVPLGFVDDITRWHLLQGAIALINPSIYESLSLVLLEAWSCEIPVVVNERCDVTRGQCARAGGGISVDFTKPIYAAKAMASGLALAERRRGMGASGNAYRRRRYQWNRVTETYEQVARALKDGTEVSSALGECLWIEADPAVNA